MLDFVLVQHFFVHQQLLSEGRFNSITLLNQLAEPIFEQTIEGLRLAHFTALFLYFFQGSHFSEKHIVSQLARSIGKGSIRALSKFIRRQVLKFGGGLASAEPAIE